MTRSIKTARRPDPHLFVQDMDLGTDYSGRRFCRCALPEDDTVHITHEQMIADLPPVPVEDVSDRIVGEGSG